MSYYKLRKWKEEKYNKYFEVNEYEKIINQINKKDFPIIKYNPERKKDSKQISEWVKNKILINLLLEIFKHAQAIVSFGLIKKIIWKMYPEYLSYSKKDDKKSIKIKEIEDDKSYGGFEIGETAKIILKKLSLKEKELLYYLSSGEEVKKILDILDISMSRFKTLRKKAFKKIYNKQFQVL